MARVGSPRPSGATRLMKQSPFHVFLVARGREGGGGLAVEADDGPREQTQIRRIRNFLAATSQWAPA